MCCLRELGELEIGCREASPLKLNHCVQPFTFKLSLLALPVHQLYSVSPHST